VELVDAEKLVELVREHLPDRAPLLEGYRGLGGAGAGRGRVARASGDDEPENTPISPQE
jgi:hypothetical protein